MTSPTQHSLKALRDSGWLCEVVEHFNSFTKRRNDLFRYADILCVRPGETMAVQTTSAPNLSARVAKILAEPNVVTCLKAGWRIEAHGWKKCGPRGKRKTWQCTVRKITL